MNLDSVRDKIQEAQRFGSELPDVELKDARGGFPKGVWNSVSALSHRPGGGLIVFGVKEDREEKKLVFVGLRDLAQIQERMGDVCSNEMSLTIRPEYFPMLYEEKHILAVYIPECPNQFKPCYYKPVGIPNGAFVRDGNTDRKITDDEMRTFLDNAKTKFDSFRAEGVDLGDLSKEKVHDLLVRMGRKTQRTVAQDDVDTDLMKNLSIVRDFNEGAFPTIAGFLIFAKDKPQLKPAFGRYIIRCVRYAGSNVASDILDSADIEGTLDEQIEGMQLFILRNIRKSAAIVGTKRIEQYEYPDKAVREVIANAVIHRDYRITETYTQVNIFEDRLEIFNPGCLPPGVTIDNIRHAQASRNEIIAARLKDLDYLEEYGRGIDIVFHEMSSRHLLPPIFKNTTNSFKVILAGEKLSQLNERQFKIWEYLVENKKVSAKLCEETVLPGVPRPTINYDLGKLQEMGLIHSMGESRKTYYEPNF